MTDNRQDIKQPEQAATRGPAQVVADAGRKGAEAGAETMHRAGDAARQTLRRGTQDAVESRRQFVQDAAERFEEVSSKVAQTVQSTTEDMRTLMMLPSAAKGGLQDLHQSVTGLVEGVMQTNMRATQELLRLANPSPFIELQQRFAREYLDALMQGSATMIRAVRRTADQTLRPLEEQIERRQQGRGGEQHYQNAAE